jgi:hypothetical protein
MDCKSHCRHTREVLGSEFRDIHKWLDEFFSVVAFGWWGFNASLFDHRKRRHHREGIEEAVRCFRGKYPEDEIRKACEIHIRDDYQGYLPSMSDFNNPEFLAKYHK